MKNMKKFIACAAVLAFMLTGCAVNTQTENKTEQPPESKASTNVVETTLEATGVAAGIDEYSSASVTWGPGNITDHKRPADPQKLQDKYSELNAQWLLEDKKQICLTFDEGYENGFTPQILDTLKEKKIKAIFFCTYDFVRDNPEITRRIIDEGHVLANHSYTHYNMTKVDIDTASDEITLMNDYVAEMFQYDMDYFRFPEGEFSEKTLALTQSLGYRSVFWSFAYADWDTQNPPNPQEAFEKITSSTHNGEIMLLHAVSKTNADILGDVIDNIRQQGYSFTTEL